MSAKVGIFGGSFNPVHLGHLVMAQDAMERFALDRVLFAPAHTPPHKRDVGIPDASHRLAMLKCAVEDNPAFGVLEDELERGGVSYTIDTVRRFRAAQPDCDVHFVIGGDTLPELHTWREIESLLGLCTFVTVARPGFDPASLPPARLKLGADHAARLLRHVVTGHLCDISSTDIRARVASGRSIRYLVPPAVERYIAAHHLYRQEN